MTEVAKNGEASEPEVENNENNNVANGDQTNNENYGNTEETPPIERSQNDRLNKILLCSFLNKLNESSSQPYAEETNSDEENNFEDDP